MNEVDCETFLKSTNEDPNACEIVSKEEKLINFHQILGITLAFAQGVNSGTTNGYASVIIAQSKNNVTIPLTKEEAAWLVSIAALPMAPGCLLSGFLLTKLRKKTLIAIITAIEILSLLIMYLSTTVTWLLIGRAINGVASVMNAPILPAYLAEITHPRARSLCLALLQFTVSVGILLIHVLGAFLSWKICALIGVILLVGCLILNWNLQETYVYHIRNGNIEAAEKAFYWYRGRTGESKAELEKLIASKHENISNNFTKIEIFRMCCSKLLLMPLGIAVVAIATMHFSGSKTIMFNSIEIVSQIIPSLDQYTSSIIVDVVRCVMIFLGSLLIKRYPIRLIFILSGIGSALSHVCFCVFFAFGGGNNSQMFQIFSLLSLISYVIFSSIGMVPLSWVIAGELFPIIIRGIGMGIFTFLYYVLIFVSVKITPDLFDLIGIIGTFIFFGGCTLIGTFIIYFILPETKNKTLKEIEDLFR